MKKLTKEDYENYMKVVNNKIIETEKLIKQLDADKKVSNLDYEEWCEWQHGTPFPPNTKPTKLSELKRTDKIFCISIYDSKIHEKDYVKITFNKRDDKGWTNFSSEHDTKPLGCSSATKNENMNNHYFLSEFSGSHMYFFTLKPETWKIDIKSAFDDLIASKNKYFSADIKKLKRGVKDLIKNN